MPFARPTLDELVSRIQADLESRLPGADAALRRRVLAVLARTIAGQFHGLYAYTDWIARQIHADTADAEVLARRAAVYNVPRHGGAQASGLVTCTGNDGAVIPAGLILQKSDGQEYVIALGGNISAGAAALTVNARLIGAAGNALTGASLTLVTPIAGVNATALVTAPGLTGGEDFEDDETLRARVLRRIQQPPHGGARFDYESWALSVPGVTRAWVYPDENGRGTVVVRFVRDNKVGTIIPSAAEVTEVQAYIDPRRPVTAEVTVAAPVAVARNFTIALAPDTTAIRAAIDTELKDLIFRDAQPGGTLLLSHIREAISIAAGEVDHTLVSPTANVTHTVGQMPVMGVITWQ